MEEENINLQMGIIMMVTFTKDKDKEKESINGTTEVCMKEIGKQTECMDTVYIKALKE